ncbi:MAG: glucose-6-phosphate isomerase [Ignavibacteria bacterium]|nr:glucose-6-phosphate isomerase [Ignavibacteria bacterium]
MKTQYFNLPPHILELTNHRLHTWQSKKYNSRIWQKDATIWKEDPKEHAELANRLGWLELPVSMKNYSVSFKSFADEVKNDFSHVLLLGMGGSSLCPEVLAKTFGPIEGYPKLAIVDTTHPAVIKKIEKEYDFKKTLFLLASKSGGTAETMSFFYRFYDLLSKQIENPGENFVALTDPNTSLEKLAKEKNFRKIFYTPSEVGGRYSALTPFGLVPAALIGIDIEKFLFNAEEFSLNCAENIQVKENPGMYLGALIGEMSLTGIDKLPFFVSPQISSFPQWVEQLVAESSGKEGKGILPVADEPITDILNYGKDRFFIFVRLENDDNTQLDKHFEMLKNAGFQILLIDLKDKYELSAEFFRWELATAFSGVVLGINPFDQPDVQVAKTLANEGLAEYHKNGKLPESTPSNKFGNIEIYSNQKFDSLEETIKNFMSDLSENEFIGILSFIPYGNEIDKALLGIRKKLMEKYKITVTTGYGPRFLHSTGQLHKGGSAKCRFIQITDSITEDVEVPGKGYSFGVLITAQALGDLKALQNKNRKNLRLNITASLAESLQKIEEVI